MSISDKDEHLYRFEFIDEDDLASIQWVWLKEHEVDSYWESLRGPVVCRQATQDEEELYEEAYADGYGVAAFLEFESKNDGVTFRVELDQLSGDADFNYTKMFQCAICQKHKDFDEDVATAGGFFLTELKDDILWHVCYDCASLESAVGEIEFEFTEEGEADS